MPDTGTWVVVPVFNEETVIADVVAEIRTVFPNVVCVDDGSRDASAEQIAGTPAHLVRHPINLGQGASLQTGIEYALRRGAERIVTFDADGQHDVHDAERMAELIRGGTADVVLGSRFLEPTEPVPALKRLVLRTVAALSPASRKLRLRRWRPPPPPGRLIHPLRGWRPAPPSAPGGPSGRSPRG